MAEEAGNKRPPKKPRKNAAKKDAAHDASPLTCGLVMPISTIGPYSADHWRDVRKVFEQSMPDGFRVRMVSEADEVRFITDTIVESLHDCEMVVCDISGKNPNVMFELGVRFSFDKPTVIVKDSDTPYSFDTSGIEHLEYPVGLHVHKIEEFREVLRKKIQSTYEASLAPEASPFLKRFSRIRAKSLDTKELGNSDFLNEAMRRITLQLEALRTPIPNVSSAYQYAFDAEENHPFMPVNSRALEAMTATDRYILLTKQVRAFLAMNPHLIETAKRSAAEKSFVIKAIEESATSEHLRSPANWMNTSTVNAVIQNELTTAMF